MIMLALELGLDCALLFCHVHELLVLPLNDGLSFHDGLGALGSVFPSNSRALGSIFLLYQAECQYMPRVHQCFKYSIMRRKMTPIMILLSRRAVSTFSLSPQHVPLRIRRTRCRLMRRTPCRLGRRTRCMLIVPFLLFPDY